MGERSDATWAAKRVGISVPRQNGKSQLLVARALAGVLLFGERKIVISAHQQDTAREAFSKLVEILEADGNQWLMDRVRPNGIMNAINREAVKFRNGATVQFKARTNAGGRGFSSDCLLLDEAQRLKRSAWVSINSTMSAMPNPQVWLLGTPPTPEDDGEVFESIRSAAITGVSSSATWAEWGADPTAEGYDPASEYTRWVANPAWNTRINHEIVQGEFESYTAEEFAQDRLGIWRSELGNSGSRAISVTQWDASAVEEPPTEGRKTFGVAFSIEGSRLALAGGLRHDDGVHVELVDALTGNVEEGLAALADWLAERRHGVDQYVLAGRAGAMVLAHLLRERRVPASRITVASTPQYMEACGLFLDGVRDGSITHLLSDGQAVLDESVAVTDKKVRGTGWTWAATVPDGDETPVEAVSLAAWAAKTSKRKARSEGAGRALVL